MLWKIVPLAPCPESLWQCRGHSSCACSHNAEQRITCYCGAFLLALEILAPALQHHHQLCNEDIAKSWPKYQNKLKILKLFGNRLQVYTLISRCCRYIVIWLQWNIYWNLSIVATVNWNLKWKIIAFIPITWTDIRAWNLKPYIRK